MTDYERDLFWIDRIEGPSNFKVSSLKNVFLNNLLSTIDIKYHVGVSVGFKASTKKCITLGYINSTLQNWVAWEYK